MIYLFSVLDGDLEGDYYSHNKKIYRDYEYGSGEVDFSDDDELVQTYDDSYSEYDDDYSDFLEMLGDYEIESRIYITLNNKSELKTKLETEVLTRIINKF
jgi:hypothetical protein